MRHITIATLTLMMVVASLAAMSDFGMELNYELDEHNENRMLETVSAELLSNRRFILNIDINRDNLLASASDTENSDDVGKKIDEEMERVNRKVDEAMKKVDEATRGLDTRVVVQVNRPAANRPYMGVVSEDLTLSKAADLGYNRFYGVLIVRVPPDTPARAQRILPDDVIMEIDGNRVTSRSILTNLIDSYNIGDTVAMKIFRNRQIIDINFTLGSRHEPVSGQLGESLRKPKLSPGNVKFSWIPVWYQPDVEDINKVLSDVGFTELDDRGQFLSGFGGKANIGNGLFLGGMVSGYKLDRKTGSPSGNNDVIRSMEYEVAMLGITLEKHIPFTRKISTSLGTMLGWGNTTLKFSQTDGGYDWNTMKDDLEQSNNNSVSLKKSHIFLQPKTELYFNLTKWLAIRGEVGYILSYSYDSGWKAEYNGDSFQVKNSPDTSFDGLTISLGPWITF